MSFNRRNYQNKKPILWLLSIIVAAVVAAFAIYSISSSNHSEIQRVTQYFLDSGSVKDPPVFDENTPEAYYVKGLISYEKNDFENALSAFKESEKRIEKATDPALKAYLYCFLNSSLVSVEGEGNIDYVIKGLEAAADYPPVANNHALIWETASSIAKDEETDIIARRLLQNILDKVADLSEEAKIRYNNCVATLFFIDGDYGESIRIFYDVKSTADLKKNTSQEYLRQVCLANSYIAGFYYTLKDYYTAIDLYEENIAFPIEDKFLNARIKQSDYINLSSSYIELNMPDKAEDVCIRMEEIYPYLEPESLADVKASEYDNMAKCEILKGDLEKAKEYMLLSQKHLEEAGEYAYYGSPEIIKLTESEYYIANKEYEKAREILEELKDSPEAAYAGLESEIYETLNEVYKELGDKDALIENQEILLNLDREFNQTIQKGYMEFSKYYEEAESAKRINSMLREQERINIGIIVTIIIVLCIVILFLIRIRKIGYIDQLTGIKNRRALSVLDKKYHNVGLPGDCAIIMIDIDFFKDYNDHYGHIMGDEVLRKVAKAIQSAVRKKDFLIRFGGEEFLIFIEQAGHVSCEELCTRILESVEKLDIVHEKSKVNSVVTISLGMCFNKNEGEKLDSILIIADEALYEAKGGGRNRYVIKTVSTKE